MALADAPDALIEAHDDGVRLVGRVEQADADGATTLRLGGSLLTLDAVGSPAAVRTTVRLEVRALRLFDTNV